MQRQLIRQRERGAISHEPGGQPPSVARSAWGIRYRRIRGIMVGRSDRHQPGGDRCFVGSTVAPGGASGSRARGGRHPWGMAFGTGCSLRTHGGQRLLPADQALLFSVDLRRETDRNVALCRKYRLERGRARGIGQEGVRIGKSLLPTALDASMNHYLLKKGIARDKPRPLNRIGAPVAGPCNRLARNGWNWPIWKFRDYDRFARNSLEFV
jgi:hypothetical protein